MHAAVRCGFALSLNSCLLPCFSILLQPATMAPYFGYSSAYQSEIREVEQRASRRIPELEAAITEGLVHFAGRMKIYSGYRLPSKDVVFAAVVLPLAFNTLKYKIRLLDHVYVMLTYGDCIFQGRCAYFSLPLCQWCERRAPWYPPGYYVAYEVTPDRPPSWDIADAEAFGESLEDDNL